jgi:hypothetical protein
LLRQSIQLILAALPIAATLGCATPGSPLPPSLDLPKPVTDLRATRQGDIVTLTWTQPTETTDKTRIRRVGMVSICRAPQATLAAAPPSPEMCFGGLKMDAQRFQALARDSGKTAGAICESLPSGQSGTVWLLESSAGHQTALLCDQLPGELQQQNPGGVANYAIQLLNDRLRGAGFSNIARVPLAPTPAPPNDLRAEASKRGILITWTPAALTPSAGASFAGYRLERRGNDPKKDSELLMIAADSPSNGHFLDTAFEWGKPYTYRIAAVVRVPPSGAEAQAEVQGAWSAPQTITPQDVFPPAQPVGVQAVYTETGSQRYIDLTWLPSQEPDLAGYVIYRRSGSSPAMRLNRELLKTPAFRDAAIEPGTAYFYSVSAVDLRGNESPRSAEASESTPK